MYNKQIMALNDFIHLFNKVIKQIKSLNKICKKCNILKYHTNYYKNFKTCKDCTNNYRRERYFKYTIFNKVIDEINKYFNIESKKICGSCKIYKDLQDFDSTGKICKLCKHTQKLCKHNSRNFNCIKCFGKSICMHKKRKSLCWICKGSLTCFHNKITYTCLICTPNSKYYCLSCRSFVVNKSNNYLCSYCNPIKKIKQKNKEIKLKKWLDSENYIITYNKRCQINNKCYMYPDFLINCNAYYLIIECDEFAHKSYSYIDERIRENNIYKALGLPCVFIRYNPDNKKIKEKTKLIILKSYIEYYKNLKNSNNELKFLFYGY